MAKRLWFICTDFKDEENKEFPMQQLKEIFKDWDISLFESISDIYASANTQVLPPDLIVIDMGGLAAWSGQFELTVRGMIANVFYKYEATPIFLCSCFPLYIQIAEEELTDMGFSPIFLGADEPSTWPPTLRQYGFNVSDWSGDFISEKNPPFKMKEPMPFKRDSVE